MKQEEPVWVSNKIWSSQSAEVRAKCLALINFRAFFWEFGFIIDWIFIIFLIPSVETYKPQENEKDHSHRKNSVSGQNILLKTKQYKANSSG